MNIHDTVANIWIVFIRVFGEHTELSIMAILASQVLLRENKKSSIKMLPRWALNLELSHSGPKSSPLWATEVTATRES